MKRQKHSLSNYRLFTGDMGKLIPINCMEALPGDTFQQASSVLLRMSPLLAPVMHPVTVRIHHWFVPNRLLWDDWEDFITGGPDGLGPATAYPTNLVAHTFAKGSVGDYLGLPVGKQLAIGQVAWMPFRAYNLIYNEWYRDEDLATESLADDDTVQNIAWEKDYFTRARPWAQKGPSVSLPIGDTAPLQTTGNGIPLFSNDGSNSHFMLSSNGLATNNWDSAVTGSNGMAWFNPQLEVDLSAATANDIRNVRTAFALQRYQEARAQYGSRYTEYLRYLGINPSDARLQRPEYLGGGKQTVAFSEVLRTGNNTDATSPGAIGELNGHGIAALRSNRFRYFCQEHGYIMTMLSVRPRTMYMDGVQKPWIRRTKEDYYQRELELVGQQEIAAGEIYATGTPATDEATWGYQDRYSEYRHTQSGVSGDFRDILDHWHLGRKFASAPTLNQSFIECDPSKRVFAEQTEHSMWVMANHSIQARRMVGKRTIGRVI